MDKMQNNSISKTLNELADEEIMRQIPLIVYLIILCISGIVGNTLVCYIYIKKYLSSTFGKFVTVMAALDLFISIVIVPLELIQFKWQYTYKTVEVCKLTLFMKAWATITSGSLLLCIAFDRYRKVCKTYSWQISSRAARIMCFGSAFVGTAVAWISPVIYSIRTKELDVYNVTISECGITEPMKKTVLPLINHAALAILFIGAFIGIIIMYILIAIRVKQQKKIRTTYCCNTDSAKHNVFDDKKYGNASKNIDFSGPRDKRQMAEIEMKIDRGCTKYEKYDSVRISEDDVINPDSASDINGSETTKGDFGTYGNREEAKGDETDSRGADMERKDSENGSLDEKTATGYITATPNAFILDTVEQKPRQACKPEKSATRKRCLNVSGSKRKRYKTTLIMFIVSLAFVVSYLPLLSLLLVGFADKTFVASLTDSGRAAYKFFYRSYLLNCAVNPVIYGIWDERFRKSFKMMFTCRKT